MHSKGFTLIELSIVLVIIGLIVGGVLGGTELIRQAELRSTLKALQGYQVTYNNFKMKYDAVPGDMANATTYFPTASNGNGDGNIYGNSSAIPVAAGEDLKAWQDLSLAGMIPFTFTGTDYNVPHSLGVKVPEAPIRGIGFRFEGIPWYESGPTSIWGVSGINLRAAALDGLSNTCAAAFTPQETMDMDRKVDDGISATGKFIGFRGCDKTFPECTNGASSFSAPGAGTYNLSTPYPACIISFLVRK